LADNILISYQSISKRFGGVQALDDVSFSIRKGDIHGLIGENGAGKSTLIKITGGIYRKDQGQVLWEGRPIEVNSPVEAERQGISIVHQEIPLCGNLTVAQNVFLGRLITNRLGQPKWDEMEERTVELFRQIGQDIDPRARVGELSVALKQLTTIVHALNSTSKFIIMDEPTSALTPGEVETLFEVLRRLKSEGTTIMIVSHILSEMMEITDRVTVLRNGRHVETMDTKDATIEGLVHMMVGDVPLPTPKESDAITGDVVLRVRGLNQLRLRLKDINFQLYKREILGLAGIQGAGRTELATTLFGVHQPDSGTIELEGREITIKNPRQAIEHGIGYLTEDRRNLGVFWDMSVWQNAGAAIIDDLTSYGNVLDNKRIEEMASKSIQDLQIKTSGMQQPIRYLSGGNQQKVLLARWLNVKPKILILDEPTRGVDVGAKAEIRKVIQELVDQGISVIVISSDLEELLAMSDRVLVMSNGAIRGEFLAKDATFDKIMALAVQK
jgi:ribose transport system ATP-binding protein